jgi:hypothetical protein
MIDRLLRWRFRVNTNCCQDCTHHFKNPDGGRIMSSVERDQCTHPKLVHRITGELMNCSNYNLIGNCRGFRKARP